MSRLVLTLSREGQPWQLSFFPLLSKYKKFLTPWRLLPHTAVWLRQRVRVALPFRGPEMSIGAE